MTVDKRAKPIVFGPMEDRIPSEFRASVQWTELPGLTAELAINIANDRIRIGVLEMRSESAPGIVSSDLAKLELRAVARHAAEAAVNPGHGAFVGRRPAMRPTPEELRLLAQVYWFQYMTWGDPRRAIMAHWEIPRATASRWIRSARELYPLPGPHGEAVSDD